MDSNHSSGNLWSHMTDFGHLQRFWTNSQVINQSDFTHGHPPSPSSRAELFEPSRAAALAGACLFDENWLLTALRAAIQRCQNPNWLVAFFDFFALLPNFFLIASFIFCLMSSWNVNQSVKSIDAIIQEFCKYHISSISSIIIIYSIQYCPVLIVSIFARPF